MIRRKLVLVLFAAVAFGSAGCRTPFEFKPVEWGGYYNETTLMAEMNRGQVVDVWRKPLVSPAPVWTDDLQAWTKTNTDESSNRLYFVGFSSAFASVYDESSARNDAALDSSRRFAEMLGQRVSYWVKQAVAQEKDASGRVIEGAAALGRTDIEVDEVLRGKRLDKVYQVKRIRKVENDGVERSITFYVLEFVDLAPVIEAAGAAVEAAVDQIEARDQALRSRLIQRARDLLETDLKQNKSVPAE